MKLSKDEELVGMASALYLIGIEVEAGRKRLEELTKQGYDYASREIAEEYKAFTRLSEEFRGIEQKYLRLKEENQPRT